MCIEFKKNWSFFANTLRTRLLSRLKWKVKTVYEEYAYERESLFEVESEFESEDEGTRSDVSDRTVSRDTVIEAYNFEVSVAISEREAVDEDDQMEAEFSEIEGKRAFPCAICDKVSK